MHIVEGGRIAKVIHQELIHTIERLGITRLGDGGKSFNPARTNRQGESLSVATCTHTIDTFRQNDGIYTIFICARNKIYTGIAIVIYLRVGLVVIIGANIC